MSEVQPLVGEKIKVRGKERTLKFTMGALRLAQRHLGHRQIRDVLENIQFDVDAVCHLAAAGLYGGDSTSKITAQKIEQFLDEDPHLFAHLVKAILMAVTEAYKRMTPPELVAEAEREENGDDEEEKPEGEAKAPVDGA
jgi:hypothetical protein